MISRNNGYVTADKEQLKKIKGIKAKRSLIQAGTMLLTVTLLSGCGKSKQEDYLQPVTSDTTIEIMYEDVEEFDFSNFNIDSDRIEIVGTNLTDVSELSNYKNVELIDISDNLLTDISALEELPELQYLDISNNSISSIDVSDFINLDYLRLEGNYNLYTEDLLEYCEQNDIDVDITKDDVINVNKLKEIIEKLNLAGLSDLEKEKKIYDFVIEHMEYDMSALKSDELAKNYNINNLECAVKGKGVCVNYVTLFDAMCELSGINCYSISGLGKGEAHRWNLVEINDQYMLCDPTWSDSLVSSGIKIFGLNLTKDTYYNRTSKDAEKFMKSHSEGYPLSYENFELAETNIRNNMAVSSDIEIIEDSETLGDKLFDKINGVIDFEDFSKVDWKVVADKFLMALSTGGAFLLSVKTSKLLKNKIDRYKEQQKLKQEQKLKEKIEKGKLDSEILEFDGLKLDDFKFDELEKEIEVVTQEPVSIIEPVEETVKKPTEQEVFASLKTNEEKIQFLNNKCNEYLRTAAEMQVDMEIYNNLIEKFHREEHVENAMIELVNLMPLSDDAKALARCHRVGYLLEVNNFDNLSRLQRESLDATKSMYSSVDSVMKSYAEVQQLLSQFKSQQMVNLTDEEKAELMIQAMTDGIDVLNESKENNFSGLERKMGFTKFCLLTILNLIISIGIIIFGIIFR